MSKQPWLKFYPADWRADPALRMCSLAARGLWIEMLAIMHEAEPRGHLLINGKAVSVRHLSSLVGASEEQVADLMSELAEAGVYSAKRNGVLYSRRMERDENKSRKLRDNGKLGGNPSLRKETTIEGLDNQGDKAQKPEARYQIPDKEKDTPAAPAGRRPPRGARSGLTIGTRVDGFEPDLSVATGLGLTAEQARLQSDQFLDFWRGVPADRGLSADWPAAWRRWVREQLRRDNLKPGSGGVRSASGAATGSAIPYAERLQRNRDQQRRQQEADVSPDVPLTPEQQEIMDRFRAKRRAKEALQ
ncbi:MULTISPECIES: hypothetical protein [unclassified Aureimonas]|uniref:hypothetical protein n=1 Tax=unclassified Aureimonas TaxID=2615206 RepID=UPI0006F2179A|nr:MULTISPECIES: hypothetical protein [unclassified Aureimonas]KQT52257.1 hypothetical protein ASG62_16510 [Aureimonas sp. Leaf427]KQT65739.1 hypothetical protein ASG54_22550 [Aureimonas sp. Leaf460]